MVSIELTKKLDESLKGLSLKRRISIKNIIMEIKDEAEERQRAEFDGE